MPSPVILLGSNPVHLSEDALVEPAGATLADLEALLASKPRAAVITSGGEPGFFRASLCLERGVPRVVLRRGAFDGAWVQELGARAAMFGAELYEHDDARGYGRVKPGARTAVGVPDPAAWKHDPVGFEIDEAWAENAAPLAMDDLEGMPANLEEVAFVRADKPVLYLVVPNHDVEGLRSKYSGMTLVCRDTPLAIEGATGRRSYESSSGRTNAHVFVSPNAELAERAAKLWADGSSRNAAALGELMGYPPCCVAAFVALGERGNNAALTYVAAARSFALQASFHPWLNTAVRHVIPFTPCSYGCPKAIAFATRVLAGLPENVATPLRRALRRPVLYFDEARAIAFEGARVQGPTLAFEQARFLPPSAPLGAEEELAARKIFGALFAESGTLVLKEDHFEIQTKHEARRPPRTVARLGVILPFGEIEP